MRLRRGVQLMRNWIWKLMERQMLEEVDDLSELVPLIEQGSPQPLDKSGTFGAALRGTLRGGDIF